MVVVAVGNWPATMRRNSRDLKCELEICPQVSGRSSGALLDLALTAFFPRVPRVTAARSPLKRFPQRSHTRRCPCAFRRPISSPALASRVLVELFEAPKSAVTVALKPPYFSWNLPVKMLVCQDMMYFTEKEEELRGRERNEP